MLAAVDIGDSPSEVMVASASCAAVCGQGSSDGRCRQSAGCDFVRRRPSPIVAGQAGELGSGRRASRGQARHAAVAHVNGGRALGGERTQHRWRAERPQRDRSSKNRRAAGVGHRPPRGFSGTPGAVGQDWPGAAAPCFAAAGPPEQPIAGPADHGIARSEAGCPRRQRRLPVTPQVLLASAAEGEDRCQPSNITEGLQPIELGRSPDFAGGGACRTPAAWARLAPGGEAVAAGPATIVAGALVRQRLAVAPMRRRFVAWDHFAGEVSVVRRCRDLHNGHERRHGA
mmetsp:Transcript_129511/g.375104  ORF Transcript_129511/g.375104 Transcript_129511/m.375104 type:complete len:286 (+) Transcript_129511:168-1025(+)